MGLLDRIRSAFRHPKKPEDLRIKDIPPMEDSDYHNYKFDDAVLKMKADDIRNRELHEQESKASTERFRDYQRQRKKKEEES